MQTKICKGLRTLLLHPTLSPASWLTISYLFVSVLWILMSDLLAVKLAGDNDEALQKIQGIKGIFFVFFSGLLLFVFSRKLYTGIKKSSKQKESIEEKFRALNEAAREGIYDYDVIEGKATLNNKMKFFFPAHGIQVADFWQNYHCRIHPEDTERVINEYEETINKGKNIWQTEFRLQGRDNKYYTVIGNTYIIRDADTNVPVRLIGAIHDVSDLRRLQKENYEQRLKHKRTLTASIIQAQETERNRWAVELHDNVCQVLAVANMYASEIAVKPERSVTVAPQLQKLLMQSISEIRQLSAHIKPPLFNNYTLLQSMKDLAANINRVDTVQFHFNTGRFDETRLCAAQKLMIYRIVQEQMNNIIKYAAATRIETTLTITGSEVKISITDNGKGFEPAKIQSGIGLRNIQSRLQIYNGRMNIRSSPGKGCTLLASFQLTSSLNIAYMEAATAMTAS